MSDVIEETWSGAGLICPYCKHMNREAYEFVRESGDETNCEHCDKPFLCHSHISVTYYGKPLPAVVAALRAVTDKGEGK